MSTHVDELHAADAKLRKADSKGQQFLESIIVGEDEKKAVGAMLQKDLKRVSGGAHKTKVVLRGNTTGKTEAKGKGGKGNRRVDTPSESSDSSSDSSGDIPPSSLTVVMVMKRTTKKKKKKKKKAMKKRKRGRRVVATTARLRKFCV
ncbi:unnamed protein product [Ectocarpus sp. 8 AP-2014]